MPTEFQVPYITIGCDPELFVQDKSGKFVSAHTLLPGTKESPHNVDGGAIQVDGVAAEFNTVPAEDSLHFAHYINLVRNQLQQRLGDDYKLVCDPVAVFDPIYWDGLPHKPKELGCNPDFNGWTGTINPPPDATTFPTMRTASGHIHIGWGKNFDVNDSSHFNDCCIVAKQMDYYLGIQSLLWDPDPRRRTMYGKAACFRAKPYGVEYRTLSNRWLSDPKLINYVFIQTYTAISSLFQGHLYEQDYGDMAKTIIDNNITDWEDKPEYLKLRRNVAPPPVRFKKTEEKKKSTLATSDALDKVLKDYSKKYGLKIST